MSEEKMKGSLSPELNKKVSDSIRPAARVRIGEKIAEIRKAKGMTQQDLADHSDVLRPNLARIEKGRVSVGIDALDSIAEALGMKVEFVDKNFTDINDMIGRLAVYELYRMRKKHHVGQMVKVWRPGTESHGHMAEISRRADKEWMVEGIEGEAFDDEELGVMYEGFRQRVVIDFYDNGLLGVGFTQGYEDDPEFAELQPLKELGPVEAARVREACMEVASIIKHSHSYDDDRWKHISVAKDKY